MRAPQHTLAVAVIVEVGSMEIQKISCPHALVMCGGVVFRKIIGQIVGAPPPMDHVLALLHPILDPEEPHVHGFRSPLLDGFVGNSGCADIVGLDGCRWLRMAHASEGCSDGNGVLGIVEESAKFGFGC